MRYLVLTAALMLCSPTVAFGNAQLDWWAGDWIIHEPSGKRLGQSRIVVQAPDAMLYEERRIGDAAVQPLWFVNSERDMAWVQLFVGASGKVRAFKQTTAPGVWPLVMGGEVVLRDGRQASFRLTVSRASNDENRRLLEMSVDRGGNWSTVFDYVYRRKA